MKKIIDGRRYDTETATQIGFWWNGLSPSDFGYVKEKLYRKKTGEFFLAGIGGANSRYAQHFADGTRCGGEGICPISIDKAKEWVTNYANEEYENVFGDCPE